METTTLDFTTLRPASLYTVRHYPFCAKTNYPDKRTTETVRNQRLCRTRNRRNHPVYLRTYHCEHCQGWHLTSLHADEALHLSHRIFSR